MTLFSKHYKHTDRPHKLCSLSVLIIGCLAVFIVSPLDCAAQKPASTPLFASATDTVTGALSCDIDATTFFRDAEFFMPFTKGYTASGFRLAPALRYNINDKASIRGGVLFTGIAGSTGLWKVEPIVTLRYQPTQWLRLTMGTIDGNLCHHLDEPLYNRERWVYDYKEDGLQIQTHTRHWESDTWLDWEHFLEPWTPDQEQFTLGTRQQFRFHGDNWSVQLPFSFLGTHRGGQFSTLDTCIETLFNGSAGLGCGYRNDRFALDLTLPAYFYKKATSAPETHLPFDQGWGIYPQLSGTLTLPQFSIHLVCGYWYGHHFISSRGSHLFQSTSWFDPNFCQAERHLATFDISISHCYRQLDFAIDAQFYYDPDHRKLDLAVGIAMRFNKSWRIF